MTTVQSTQVRTDAAQPETYRVLLAAAYVAGTVATIAVASGVAAVMAGVTGGLGQFVLLMAGWLGVVAAWSELSERAATRLVEIGFGKHAPRSTRTVDGLVTGLVGKQPRHPSIQALPVHRDVSEPGTRGRSAPPRHSAESL